MDKLIAGIDLHSNNLAKTSTVLATKALACKLAKAACQALMGDPFSFF